MSQNHTDGYTSYQAYNKIQIRINPIQKNHAKTCNENSGCLRFADPILRHSLFTDEWAEKGKTYFYRIKGTNEAGDSEWSQIVEVTR